MKAAWCYSCHTELRCLVCMVSWATCEGMCWSSSPLPRYIVNQQRPVNFGQNAMLVNQGFEYSWHFLLVLSAEPGLDGCLDGCHVSEAFVKSFFQTLDWFSMLDGIVVSSRVKWNISETLSLLWSGFRRFRMLEAHRIQPDKPLQCLNYPPAAWYRGCNHSEVIHVASDEIQLHARPGYGASARHCRFYNHAHGEGGEANWYCTQGNNALFSWCHLDVTHQEVTLIWICCNSPRWGHWSYWEHCSCLAWSVPTCVVLNCRRWPGLIIAQLDLLSPHAPFSSWATASVFFQTWYTWRSISSALRSQDICSLAESPSGNQLPGKDAEENHAFDIKQW